MITNRGMLVLIACSMLIAMNCFTLMGGIREKRKVKFQSGYSRILCGFFTWIEEADILIVLLNLINVLLIIVGVVGRFICQNERIEQFFAFFSDDVKYIYMIAQMACVGIIACLVDKEHKKNINFRETVDLQEQKGTITAGSAQVSFQYIQTTSKRKETPAKLIVFLPESYNNITLDADGNISKYDKKEGWKKTHNMGAYEELSDALVRAGYATVRFGREKREHDLPASFVMKKEIIEAYLENEPFEGEIYLLAHGLGNTELKQLTEGRKVNGIISLCGAAAGFWESCVNRGVWMGGNRKRLEKLYQKQMDDAPQELAFLRTTRSRRVEEFVEIAKAIPIFLGYVEYDPYYDEQLVGEIKSFEEGKIAYHYYQDTDFTLRFRRKNIRKGVHVDGQEIGLDMPRLNPRIAEEMMEWMNRG